MTLLISHLLIFLGHRLQKLGHKKHDHFYCMKSQYFNKHNKLVGEVFSLSNKTIKVCIL